MKFFSYSLFCFIFCFLGMCDSEEDKCKKERINYLDQDYPAVINCNVLVTIVDTQGGENCGVYGVEFEKYHCTGGVSSLMSYGYNGCYEDGGVTYLGKVGVGNHGVNIEYNTDYIDFTLKDVDNNSLYEYMVIGQDIAGLTNGGKKSGILVTFYIPNYSASVRATSN